MLKVLIVDDEFLARVGLRSIIDWTAHGYEIVAEAENGQQALQHARTYRPDIIISDVRMPVMNGIELLESVTLEKLNSQFIMLSSYDDFALVRGALKAGAADYLLKLEMEPDSLLATLNNVSSKIKKLRALQQTEQQRSMLIESNHRELGKVFIKEVLEGKVYTEAQLSQRLSNYQLHLESYCLVVVVFRVFGASELSAEGLRAWKQLLDNESTSSANHVIIESGDTDFIGIYSFDEQHSVNLIEVQTNRMCRAVIETAKRSFNVEVAAGLSKKHQGLLSLRQCYLEAEQAVSLTEKLKSSEFESVQGVDWQQYTSQVDHYISDIAEKIRINDCQAIVAGFDSLATYLKHNKMLPPSMLLGGSYALHYMVSDFVRQCGLERTQAWRDIQSTWLGGSTIEGVDGYIDWITQLKAIIVDAYQNRHESHYMILKAKRYVTEHIDQAITLKAVSDHLGLSPSYFSRLFSQETEQCFVDYVREQKINTAKHLIRTTNKKMYQIASLVGYENVHYFSRVFKQTTDITPIAFRTGKNS
ncbi:response regulator [Vibrio maritimus]|uniref:response regulator n=1 Tax=Vibrio maritimus TaxID=990268 RepID=UPI001F42448A|nr:response regulator [Vibrio maritimus]